MSALKLAKVLWLLLIAAGCSTSGKKESVEIPVSSRPPIDLRELQQELGMDVSPEWVGYREKRFDACRFQADLPKNFDCNHVYFVQIGIKLSCRPEDDAQNPTLEDYELTPVAHREVSWKLGETSGRLSTDDQGYGLVLAIASSTMKSKMLRVSTGDDFLMIRSEQATRIVTPTDWCKLPP